jgi:Ca2+-binding RTX toxin-like protein
MAKSRVPIIIFSRGTDQNDMINGGQADSISATGYLGDDQITGSDGSDYLGGNEGNDTIVAGKGNDVLLGGAGNDDLSPGAGDDETYGGAGDDILRLSGAGVQLFDGGIGHDTFLADLRDWTTLPLDFLGEINLLTELAGQHKAFHTNQDIVRNIENVTLLGDVDYVIVGNFDNNVLVSGDGDDTLDGGDGDDVLDGGAGTNSLAGGLGDDTYRYAYRGTDTVSDSGGLNDTLYVTSRDEDHVGYFGDSYVENGNLVLVSREDNTKLLIVENAFTDAGRIENITLHADSGQWDDLNYRISSLEDSFTGKEILYFGTRSDDILVMNDGYNEATLSAGNDTVKMGNGGGYVLGGDGNDIVYGGAGNDWILVVMGPT